MRRISWIGVGIMGKAMVRNLMKAGYEVHIYARHPEKVADVVSEGAVPHGSIAECVKASEVVITMVGFPKDVEEVYFAPGNILDSAAKGMTLIDMTTTSPTLAQRIYREGTARGLRVLDAPVTGGDSGARAGTLSILVGGDQADAGDGHDGGTDQLADGPGVALGQLRVVQSLRQDAVGHEAQHAHHGEQHGAHEEAATRPTNLLPKLHGEPLSMAPEGALS